VCEREVEAEGCVVTSKADGLTGVEIALSYNIEGIFWR
jgi:hypothetical protein